MSAMKRTDLLRAGYTETFRFGPHATATFLSRSDAPGGALSGNWTFLLQA